MLTPELLIPAAYVVAMVVLAVIVVIAQITKE